MVVSDESYLRQALQLAKQAEKIGEVPIGAVLVYDNDIVGQGWNQPIASCDPTAHAEMIAMRDAAKCLQNYRLPNTTLYVTLEPCAMCAAAMIHARINRLVFSAYDPKSAAGIIFSSALTQQLNHQIEVVGGVLQEESAALLTSFFQRKR